VKLKIFTITLVSLVLASLCCGALAQRARTKKHNVAPADRWYVFISPDGDFTLSFPERPIRELDQQSPGTSIKSYAFNTQSGMRFSINFQSGADNPSRRLANEWNDGYEQELLTTDRENNRRVVHTQRIGKDTFEAEIWDAGSNTSESINYLRRTIVRQTRIYTLLCGSEVYGRRVNKSICRRFFNSMHFIDKK
jgi:hypothetical protein